MERKEHQAETLRSWLMVSLTVIFLCLYALVLFGFLRPFADITLITRIEPVIFVIIGYFFGRLPLQQTERLLRDELTRQKLKADSAQQAKENVEIEKEVMIEKIKNARAALLQFERAAASTVDTRGGIPNDLNGGIHSSIHAAVRILGT